MNERLRPSRAWPGMNKVDLERSNSQLRGLEWRGIRYESGCSSKGTAVGKEFSNSKIGISPDAMDVDKSSGDKTGDGGISSRRAIRLGDDGGGRIVDWLSLVAIAMVITEERNSWMTADGKGKKQYNTYK